MSQAERYVHVSAVTHKLMEGEYSTPQSPDPTEVIEILTDEAFDKTQDYVYNTASAKFFPVGIKQSLAKPETQKVQVSPFADTGGFLFKGKGFKGTAVKSPDGNPHPTSIDR